ncbi:WGR domain-containing protein [Aetokthonos hydrillicola Thurmond2011]|jgi:predicted DNA-binding WGR domain protein|uniref:WGR domain-containing protein n=1 Tax=Aetokthonos hydrillicola Thurmond2011 TaxID=2712845 RepID=A0AAP5I8D2_9CYAN|nr:WGR domain-containing protein [Aetokthonos hydrillicola]MBO3460411.1 WGR domain-containing protein [Aetokthonos hydrillicola CCALA 1050]MBW4588513.1 WGR domain-containing protein [Aetokthonos hydrillicola CCALA 1050]MDR9896842.1 WGR domain-containing protein [Aetokthonos hydrillicola Thurmond2011]
MTEEKTYLELSENDGKSHKFYEVIVKDAELIIRYGRIGDHGQTQSKTFPTADKAKAEATKKINEKLKKGYEHAVMGVRQKRPVTRRQVTSSPSTAKQAPILWKFNSSSAAFGIFIDAHRCWVGNQSGQVFAVNHQGSVINQFQLPDGVKCLVADDSWIYAGCDDGNVYDLTGKLPRLAYKIDENVDIFWLDIKDGLLAVSDANGGVTTFNHDDDCQWTRLSQGSSGWMVRCNEASICHGHSLGVTMYDTKEGRMLWHQNTGGAVLFGWQEASAVYAGTSDRKVYCFSNQGEELAVYTCDASVYSCATTVDGEYVFAGDNSSSIYCFNHAGERLWKLASGCGSALSMQFFNNCIYIVTTDGTLACIDASVPAITAAQEGTVPEATIIQAPSGDGVTPSTVLETATDTSQGIIVECFRSGNKLRIRVVSPGYNSNWNVQFPKDIRQEGQRYLVQEVRESSSGEFYRARGDIKKLI